MRKVLLNIFVLLILIVLNNQEIRAEVWNLDDAEYLENQLDISGQETDPKLMFWHPDGDRFFMIGDISDRVHLYNVDIPWDINTAEYSGISYDFSAQVTDPKGLFFRTDGLKMYLNDCWTDCIYQYSLSTCWDVSTLSYDGVSYHFVDQLTNPKSLYFKPDGSRCYIDCYAHDRIYQFDLSDPWEIGSISYNEASYYFHDIEDQPQQVSFRPDGSEMYLNGSGGNSIYRFILGTAWDVTTAEYTGDILDICAMNNDHAIRGHHFSVNGHFLYMIGCQHKKISQFTLESSWELGEAYFSNYCNFSSEDGDMQNLTISSDGSRMFLQGYTGKCLYQYDLKIPWDIRSAHYNEISYYFGEDEENPRGMYFRADGNVLYLCGSESDKIWQYSLSIPWDISTINIESNYLDISSVEANCRDLYLKPDGTKLYLAGTTHCVFQYTLSIPWDITSAEYDEINHYTNEQTCSEHGIFIKPDGSMLYMVSSSDDVIYEYTLSEPWDISSMDYSGVSLCLHYYEGDARDVYFKPDGGAMYFLGKGADRVYQFSLEIATSPTNNAPEINLPDSVSFIEDNSLEIDFSPYLYDADGDSITLCCSGNENIDVNISGFSVFFSSLPDWNGEEIISFGANDDSLRTLSIDQMRVIVIPVNDIPVLNFPDTLCFNEDSSLDINIQQYVTEVDNDSLELSYANAQNIEFAIDGLDVHISAPENWYGSEDIEFILSDGVDEASAEVHVEVQAVNDIPWLELPDSIVFYSDTSIIMDFSAFGGDVDNEYLQLTVTGNDSIEISINEMEVSFCSLNNWLGNELVNFCVDDYSGRACSCDSVMVMSCPSGKPLISSIIDRPNDQGGYVYISFDKCYYDNVQYLEEGLDRSTEFYTIWSEIDGNWVALNTVGALGEDEYTALVSTATDSVSIDSAEFSYRVSAHMDEGTWMSETETGYSADNLAPFVPSGLMFTDDILSWIPCNAEDLSYYSIYFNSELLTCTSDNSFSALGYNGTFNVTATDIHENESLQSNPVDTGLHYGDVDTNGSVEAYDASLVLQYFCLLPPDNIPLPWDDWRIELADVDNNGWLEAYDASLILRYSVDMIDHFPVEDVRK